MRPGLERIEGLLAALGHPEGRYRLAQVGGTNGKGSVAAILAAILKAAGHRVGLYTSPHLVSFRERIRVNGEPVSEDSVVDGVEALGTLVARLDATMFEAATALALDHFAREAVDIAVLEVGLGGRLDATTVGVPAVTVVTRIDLDHQAVLGTTLAAIAAEKAAIIRAGVAVVASQAPEAMAVVLARDGGWLVLDGAHNPGGARALATSLRDHFGAAPVTFVVGILRDKDAPAILAELAPLAHRLILTASSNRRAADPAALRAAVPPAVPRVELAASPVEALALAGRSPKSPVVCVAGSLSLIGDVWRHLAGSDDPCPVEVDIMGSLF